VARRYWIETLGCPKNQVDSDKIAGSLAGDGLEAAGSADEADVVVVNTCGFIEAARAESIETILELDERRAPGARLVVTGCLAARSPEELKAALPEVEVVAGYGVPVALRHRGLPGPAPVPGMDLLELPRPAPGMPWAYVKVAEGCDRRCGFCAIPSFRGRQRSRPEAHVVAEVDALVAAGVREVVLVAQDLASYGRDLPGTGGLVELLAAVAARVPRVRLLYLYPASLDDRLIEAIAEGGVAYFDLSLQHVASGLLRRMRRPGSAERFLERIATIRRRAPEAALRSSFILGYPGETEEDHDALLGFLEEAQLDWAGFFTFSPEEGTYAMGLGDQVATALAEDRRRECSELQDRITATRRARLVGTACEVLIDVSGVARSHREAPEIDGLVRVPEELPAGRVVEVEIVACEGVDLVGTPVAKGAAGRVSQEVAVA
jgi:ribosomal protein S12 methylthiotransferase